MKFAGAAFVEAGAWGDGAEADLANMATGVQEAVKGKSNHCLLDGNPNVGNQMPPKMDFLALSIPNEAPPGVRATPGG